MSERVTLKIAKDKLEFELRFAEYGVNERVANAIAEIAKVAARDAVEAPRRVIRRRYAQSSESAARVKERDEARREVCRLIADPAGDPRVVALSRGWEHLTFEETS